ncbi:hypothetical protein D9M71_232070 [compost metagenome]
MCRAGTEGVDSAGPQGPLCHGGGTAVGVGAGQGQGVIAEFADAAAATDNAPESLSIVAVENQRTVIGYIAENAARRTAIAQLQRSRGNARACRVGIAVGQDQRAIARLVQRTGRGAVADGALQRTGQFRIDIDNRAARQRDGIG